MDILDKIIIDKRKEVLLRKQAIQIAELEQTSLFKRNTISLSRSLKNSGTGVIAEYKRKSPSKSTINESSTVKDVAKGYESAGVSGMSVLTDSNYFGGSLDDLLMARGNCKLPLLRKEFIIDEFQIIEAKAYGADVVLLIASVLSRDEIKKFSELAKDLNLEVLLEIHNEKELHKAIMPSLDMIGVNNRNLKTFEVNIQTSKNLSALIPDDFLKISESGISATATIKDLMHYGYQGFLIGENFMKTENPGASATAFIKKLSL